MSDLQRSLARSGLLTREEAAKQLGVSPDTITRYLYDGRLDGFGPVVLVSKSSVAAYRKTAKPVGRPRRDA